MNLPVKYDELTWWQRKEIREKYKRLQRHKCMHCGSNLEKDPPWYILEMEINWNLFPPNFLKHPIHLQHDHKTGLTEGAVHAYCNAVMWQYEGK